MDNNPAQIAPRAAPRSDSSQSAPASDLQDMSTTSTSQLPSPDEKTPKSPNVETRPHENRSNVFKIWISELMSILLALLALGGLLGLVIPYHGQKAVPNWPSTITLNTIISILANFLKAGLIYATAEALSQQKWISFRSERQIHHMSLFDRASRGPTGALVLMFHKSTWSAMSILGAALVFLAVAIGPFAQQLLSFKSCQLQSRSAQASIPRLAMYAVNSLNPIESSDTGGPRQDMQASVFAGIYAPQANIIPIACPSGNCSFTEYRTLAYCSKCTDISDQLVYSTTNFTNEEGNSQVQWNYTLPSGTHTMWSNIEPMMPMVSNFTDSYEVVWSAGDSPAPCKEADRSDPFKAWPCQGYGAANCTIKPCVRTYTAEVKEGVATERLRSTASQFYTRPGESVVLAMVDVPCLSQNQRQKLVGCGYSINNTTDMVPYRESLELTAWDDGGNPQDAGYGFEGDATELPGYCNHTAPTQCVYQMSISIRNSVELWLEELLSGSVGRVHSRTDGGVIWSGSNEMKKMYNDSNPSFAYVDSLFKNISDGITANLRQLGNTTAGSLPQNVTDMLFAGNEPAYGMMLENNVCVHLRWL